MLRHQSKTAEGTSNLVKTVKACLDSQGILVNSSRSTAAMTAPLYSPAAHRVLLALRCAKSLRPFNSIADVEYQLEVAMLRPNTIIPNPITISRDIKRIYIELSHHVKDYFVVCFLPSFGI